MTEGFSQVISNSYIGRTTCLLSTNYLTPIFYFCQIFIFSCLFTVTIVLPQIYYNKSKEKINLFNFKIFNLKLHTKYYSLLFTFLILAHLSILLYYSRKHQQKNAYQLSNYQFYFDF